MAFGKTYWATVMGVRRPVRIIYWTPEELAKWKEDHCPKEKD